MGILWITLGQITIIKKCNIDIQSENFGDLIKALFLVLLRRKIIYYLKSDRLQENSYSVKIRAEVGNSHILVKSKQIISPVAITVIN